MSKICYSKSPYIFYIVTVQRQCHLLKKVIRKNIFNNSMNLVYLRIHLKSWDFILAKLVFHDNHFSYFNKNIRKYMFMGNLNKCKQKFIFCSDCRQSPAFAGFCYCWNRFSDIINIRRLIILLRKRSLPNYNLQDMILIIWQSCELSKAHVSFPTTKLSHWSKYLVFPANIFLV